MLSNWLSTWVIVISIVQTVRASVFHIYLTIFELIPPVQGYRNEVDLGVALAESKVPRSELYITTKVLSGAADPESALAASLKKLQLDHVDLYLIHAPYFADEGKDTAQLQNSWAALERLQAAGKATSIGVSNFLPAHLDAVLQTAKVVPAVNQIEFHAYLPREELVSYCHAKGIGVEAYGPLSPVTRGAPGPLDALLDALARKYAVTSGEVLLRWCIEQDVVAVTTSAREQRLSDYLRCTRFRLTPAEVKEIGRVGKEKHARFFWGKKFAEDDPS
jgi:diketogulonate reductase-like aldo/keto reductase